MLWVRGNSWSPNCVSQDCVTHNLHSVTLSQESDGSACLKTNAARLRGKKKLWSIEGCGGPSRAGGGTEKGRWSLWTSAWDGAPLLQGEMGKCGTLQLEKKQLRRDMTEVYQLMKLVDKVRGQSYPLIPQYYNQYSTLRAQAASWGDLTIHCCQRCSAWGHSSTREGKQASQLKQRS